jgi:phosphoserine phosphatase RsbU/P
LFDPPVSYDISSLVLEPGDSILFFSDGLSDAFEMAGERFEIERLQAVCEAQRQSSPTELLEDILSAVSRFAQGRTQHDGMAAAVFHGDEQ